MDGEGDTCGMCFSEKHGCDTFNSCVEHGEGQVAKRVHQGVGKQSQSVRVPGLGFGDHSKVLFFAAYPANRRNVSSAACRDELL